MHWYTADPHFFHQAIIKHCNRPFKTAEEMNIAILKGLTDTVKPTDTLWIVGDLFFTRTKENFESFFAKIPGQKHLVRGNHDDKRIERLGWAGVHDMKLVKDDGSRFFLCHYPLMTWPGSRYDTLHLFGHVHNNWAGTDRSLNIGVDLWDFKPTHKQALIDRAKSQPKMPLWDTLEPGT